MRAYERLLKYAKVYTTSDPNPAPTPLPRGNLTSPTCWWKR